MKSFFLAVALLSSPLAQAAPMTLEQAVAQNIQGLVDDTVNEGGQSAYVIYNRSQPAVSCKSGPSKRSPSETWAFCKIDFKVKDESGAKTIRECGLLYSFNPQNIEATLRRGQDKFFDTCLENLSESID